MKPLELYLILLVSIISCQKKHENNSLNLYSNYKMNVEKKIYYLDYHIPSSTRVDVLINKIKIKTSSLDGYEELNPYILKSGKNIIEVKLYSLEGYVIEPYHIKQKENELTPLRIRVYTTDEKEENIEKLIEFNNPVIESSVPVYKAQWEFEAQVPYILEGWTNAQDLSKLDQELLEKKVVAKFNEYRKLLNSGQQSIFIEQQEFATTEVFDALYFSKDKREHELNFNFNYFKLQQGIMLPLENYQMKLYAKGKLVTLERIDTMPKILDDGEEVYLYNKNALISYREKPLEEDGVSFYYDYVLLMMPKESDELQIARVIQSID